MCAPSQGAMLPYNLKIPSPYFPFGPSGGALSQAHLSALDFQRSQLNDYNVRVQLGFRNYQNSLGLSPFHPYITDPYSQAFFYKHDPRARFVQEEPKPSHSYIGLIAMAILSSKEKKLVLSDIYQWILDNYPYFRSRGPGWRNSIRHNLSLNDCFIKSGRSANGKGHYWAVHPANVEDFERGDFRRRRAQRKVRRHMGLSVPDDDDSPSPSPTQPWPMGMDTDRPGLEPASPQVEHKCLGIPNGPQVGELLLAHAGPTFLPGLRKPSKRRLFDMASLLAPDEDDDIDVKRSKEEVPDDHPSGQTRCCSSRCLSPTCAQDAVSPCSRTGAYCGSEDGDHDDDNEEEIEVASGPNSPMGGRDEKNTTELDEHFDRERQLSIDVQSGVDREVDLNTKETDLPSQNGDGALDLSSPSSSEVDARSPLNSSPYSSRMNPSAELVSCTPGRVKQGASPAKHTQCQASRTSGSPSSPNTDFKSVNVDGVFSKCGSESCDPAETRTASREDIKSSNAASFDPRPGVGFMPPAHHMGFDLSKLRADNLHYFHLQLQGGRPLDLHGVRPDLRFDHKLGLREVASSFDSHSHPDALRSSLVGERQLATNEAARLVGLGPRWGHVGFSRAALPARDRLGMFTSLALRPHGVFSPFQGTGFPLAPEAQRAMPPMSLVRTSLPNGLQATLPSSSPATTLSPSSSTLSTSGAPVLNSSPMLPPASTTHSVINVPCNNNPPGTSGNSGNSNGGDDNSSKVAVAGLTNNNTSE